MTGESAEAFRWGLYIGSFGVAAVVTFGLARLSRRIWLGFLAGSAAPPIITLGYFFYLESQQPYGPFAALVGLVYSVPALLFGMGGAAASACLLAFGREDSEPGA